MTNILGNGILYSKAYASTDEVETEALYLSAGAVSIAFEVYLERGGTVRVESLGPTGTWRDLTDSSLPAAIGAGETLVLVVPFPLWKAGRLAITPTDATSGQIDVTGREVLS